MQPFQYNFRLDLFLCSLWSARKCHVWLHENTPFSTPFQGFSFPLLLSSLLLKPISMTSHMTLFTDFSLFHYLFFLVKIYDKLYIYNIILWLLMNIPAYHWKLFYVDLLVHRILSILFSQKAWLYSPISVPQDWI